METFKLAPAGIDHNAWHLKRIDTRPELSLDLPLHNSMMGLSTFPSQHLSDMETESPITSLVCTILRRFSSVSKVNGTSDNQNMVVGRSPANRSGKSPGDARLADGPT